MSTPKLDGRQSINTGDRIQVIDPALSWHGQYGTVVDVVRAPQGNRIVQISAQMDASEDCVWYTVFYPDEVERLHERAAGA